MGKNKKRTSFPKFICIATWWAIYAPLWLVYKSTILIVRFAIGSPLRHHHLSPRRNMSVEREILVAKHGARCEGCGLKLPVAHLEVDHIKPRKHGGGDHIRNLQLLCGPCNRIKGTKSQAEFHAELRRRGLHHQQGGKKWRYRAKQ